MHTAAIERTGRDVPAWWPAALTPRALKSVIAPTPFLACDLDTVRDRYHALCALLPTVRPHYAVKCNPAPEILRTLASCGAGFEVASFPELALLRELGVNPADVLYSNTVKPPAHVAAAAGAGLWRFAVDGPGEIRKIAQHAPGSAVYVRVRVDDASSAFPLSRKFGADGHRVRSLLREARDLGLQPYGLTFHVGSQSTSAASWTAAMATIGRVMDDLQADGIVLEMLDIGGGFPARYAEPVIALEEIAAAVLAGLHALPYVPPLLVSEPGRGLVAESGVMVATVLGREVRAGENWLYLDVGAYNGLMETMQAGARWRFPVWTSRVDHGLVPHIPFTVTGPSCDSSDTMFTGIPLPSSLVEGDRLYIGSAGAYTLSYASSFNGFAPPAAVFVGGR